MEVKQNGLPEDDTQEIKTDTKDGSRMKISIQEMLDELSEKVRAHEPEPDTFRLRDLEANLRTSLERFTR